MHRLRSFVLVFGLAVIGAAQAKEVTLQHEGLTLNANLELATGRKLADGAVLITHGMLAHRDMEALVYLRSLLEEKGYNTLVINLSLGLNNRHGMYDCKVTHRHRQTDAAGEIGAWVGWLKKQGAKRVAVLGHSNGGAQTAFYAAERDNTSIRAAMLMAPATRDNNDAAAYQKRYQKPLAPVLEKAQKQVNEGKGATVLTHTDFLYCPDTSVTADAFVSYYGPGRLDTPSLLPKIKKPTLVIVAGNDDIVVGLDKKVKPLADGKRVQMKVIDGADHFFRDLFADDAVEAIDTFLKGAGF